MTGRRKLDTELAAYSPCELNDFMDTLDVLLDVADDNSIGYCAIRARIQHVLNRAVEKQLKAELKAQRTGEVIPFPGRAANQQ